MQRVNMGVIQTFARKEIKFLLTEQQYQDFLPLLNHYMNPDFLIRESLEKPDYKEKIRLRSYLSPAQPEDTVFLEIKKKICGIVNKRRVTMTLAQAEAYLQDHIRPDLGGVYLQEQVMDEIEEFRSRYAIEPKQYISYQRAAYFGKDDADFRLTFDRALTGRRSDISLRQQSYGDLLIPPQMRLMEVKISESMPMWLAEELAKLQSIRNVCAEPNEMGPSAVHH